VKVVLFLPLFRAATGLPRNAFRFCLKELFWEKEVSPDIRKQINVQSLCMIRG